MKMETNINCFWRQLNEKMCKPQIPWDWLWLWQFSSNVKWKIITLLFEIISHSRYVLHASCLSWRDESGKDEEKSNWDFCQVYFLHQFIANNQTQCGFSIHLHLNTYIIYKVIPFSASDNCLSVLHYIL